MLVHACTSIHILSTVPEQITPVKQMDTDSQITIKWTETSEDIVRYVLDVREYSSAGPGKTKNKSITGYPRVIPATETQYIVTSLSELHTSRYNSDYVIPYPFPVPLTPSTFPFSLTLSPLQSLGSHMNTYLWLGMYVDVEISTIHLLSSLRKNVCYVALYMMCGDIILHHTPDPSHFPHNVTVKRLNGTAMNVSFVELSLVEARRRTVVYTITYSPSGSRKRQVKEVIVPNDTSHHVIGGLNPDSEYTVRVSAGDGRGNENTSKPVSVPLEGLCYFNVWESLYTHRRRWR